MPHIFLLLSKNLINKKIEPINLKIYKQKKLSVKDIIQSQIGIIRNETLLSNSLNIEEK